MTPSAYDSGSVTRCQGIFNKGHCHKGGSHERASAGANYTLPHDVNENVGNQGNWRFCLKCSALFWNGDPGNKGLCPAGGNHQAQPTAFNYVLPNDFAEDANNQGLWRFCGKCAGMYWDGDQNFKGFCPKDGKGHTAIGLIFVLVHDINEDAQNQKNWRFCGKCGGMFWDGDPHFKGVCPSGQGHVAPEGSYNFVLKHEVNEDSRHQKFWRFCGKSRSSCRVLQFCPSS